MAAPFSPSFLSGEARATRFLTAGFRGASARAEHVQRVGARQMSEELLAVLRRQDAKWPASEARQRNLEALAQPGTVAVVTGQQVALFLGPLYSFYKAASAIAAARALQVETGRRCVPIFWLQTEDHDFAEIDHCHSLDAEHRDVTLRLEGDSSAPHADRVSVEHRVLGPSISVAVHQLESCLERLPHALEVLNLVRAHYRPTAMLAEAFGGMMAAVFEAEGLIVIDPRDAGIAALAAPLHRRAIESAGAISEVLSRREHALEEAGFEAQVHVREGSPLSFFHLDAPEGPRFRMVPEGTNWSLVGSETRVSADEVSRLLREAPLRFSSSALLRPILQDTLLPTAGYVAGPGEINYFAQLAPLYDFFDLPQPLVIPRARFRLIEPRVRALLDSLRLQPSEVERSSEDILRSLGGGLPAGQLAPQAVEARIREDVERTLTELAQAGTVDPDVLAAIRRTRGTIDRAASRLAGRYQRALLEKDRVAQGRVERLRGALFPSNMPQERFQSLPYFASKFGLAGLKEQLLGAIDPFAAEIRDLPL